MSRGETNRAGHLFRMKETYKKHIERLDNYKRVLLDALDGCKVYCKDDEVRTVTISEDLRKELQRELIVTDTLINMLIKIHKMSTKEYGGMSHDEMCREKINIDSERLYHIISNGTRSTNDELYKIILFNIN